jgi:hypothetical protein
VQATASNGWKAQEMHLQFLRMRELGPFLRENGFRIGDSTIEKLTAPSGPGGGPPFKWFGTIKLYGDEVALQWARENLRDKRQPFRTTDRKEENTDILKERPDAGTPGREQSPTHQDREDCDVNR